MANLNPDIENKIKEKAFYYSEQGRCDYNVTHLQAAVYYMKELLKSESGNPRILIPAIYLHDIGYAGRLQEKGYAYKDTVKVKSDHMAIGAKMSQEILKEIGSFTDEEIKAISHLVGMHDKLEEINTPEEQLVFEADSLSMADRDRVKPSFDKENYLEWLDHFINDRASRFKTETGKKFLQKLLPKTKTYFD